MFYKYRKKTSTTNSPSKTSKGAPRKPNLVKKLDKIFSLYIRLRDVMPSGCFRCISCGKIKRWEDGDCGHFYSRTHMATRWDEDNCHMECTACNRMSADHIIGYRDNLAAKIGIGRLDRLKVLSSSVCHWQDFELEEKIEHYKKEVKRLSREKGISVKI